MALLDDIKAIYVAAKTTNVDKERDRIVDEIRAAAAGAKRYVKVEVGVPAHVFPIAIGVLEGAGFNVEVLEERKQLIRIHGWDDEVT
jgi:hypothetical protein